MNVITFARALSRRDGLSRDTKGIGKKRIMLVKIVLKPVYSDARPKEPAFRRCALYNSQPRGFMTFLLGLLWQSGAGVRVIN